MAKEELEHWEDVEVEIIDEDPVVEIEEEEEEEWDDEDEDEEDEEWDDEEEEDDEDEDDRRRRIQIIKEGQSMVDRLEENFGKYPFVDFSASKRLSFNFK